MPSRLLPVPSDPSLLADIRQYGKFDTAGCYHCGTCMISCEPVTESASFPRKIILYALLGLREPLLSSLEPWICEDCGDCSLVCPRQAEPRISMVTLRRFLSAQYDWTGIAPRVLRSKTWHLSLLIAATLITLALILSYHLWYVGLHVSDLATPLGLKHMFPLMTYYTLAVMLLPLLLLFSRVIRIWRLKMTRDEQRSIPLSDYAREAWVYRSITQIAAAAVKLLSRRWPLSCCSRSCSINRGTLIPGEWLRLELPEIPLNIMVRETGLSRRTILRPGRGESAHPRSFHSPRTSRSLPSCGKTSCEYPVAFVGGGPSPVRG